MLQASINKVATAFGISKLTYGGPKRKARGLHPCQGSGQGNVAGPAGFAGMSSTGIACMRKHGYGAFLRACISLVSFLLVCFMWVDDNSYQQTAKSGDEPGEEVVEEIQAGLNYWVGFLTITGGAINPDKSYWYLLDYRWTGTQWVYRKAREMEGGLTAPNPDGVVLPLKRL